MAESVPFLDSGNRKRDWDAEKEDYPTRSRPSHFFNRYWKDIALLISITSTLVLSISQVHNSYTHVADVRKSDFKTSIRKDSSLKSHWDCWLKSTDWDIS